VVTYTVVVKVSNPEGKLKPGMTANVTIPVAEARGVLRVPNAAFSFKPVRAGASGGGGVSRDETADGDGSTLWVLGQKGSLRPVRVELGISDGSLTAISGDLREGGQIVTGIQGSSGNGGSQKQSGGGPPPQF
jgi:HlyD family secretion protein